MSFHDKEKKEDDSGMKMFFWGIALIVSSFIMDIFARIRRREQPEISEEDEVQCILRSSTNVIWPEENPNLPGTRASPKSEPSGLIYRQMNQERDFTPKDGIYVPQNKADEGAYYAKKALENAESAVDISKLYKDLRATHDDEWMTGFWEELSKRNPDVADYIEKSYMQSLGGTVNKCHPSKFESLNNNIIPEDMRRAFANAGASLSDDAAVSIKKKDISWVIKDGDKTYTIWKEDDRISIYAPRVTFGTKGKPYMKKGGAYTEQDYADFAQDMREWFEKLGTPPREVAAYILRHTRGWEPHYIGIIVRHQSPEVQKIIGAGYRNWWRRIV